MRKNDNNKINFDKKLYISKELKFLLGLYANNYI